MVVQLLDNIIIGNFELSACGEGGGAPVALPRGPSGLALEYVRTAVDFRIPMQNQAFSVSTADVSCTDFTCTRRPCFRVAEGVHAL